MFPFKINIKFFIILFFTFIIYSCKKERPSIPNTVSITILNSSDSSAVVNASIDERSDDLFTPFTYYSIACTDANGTAVFEQMNISRLALNGLLCGKLVYANYEGVGDLGLYNLTERSPRNYIDTFYVRTQGSLYVTFNKMGTYTALDSISCKLLETTNLLKYGIPNVGCNQIAGSNTFIAHPLLAGNMYHVEWKINNINTFVDSFYLNKGEDYIYALYY